MMKAFVQSCPCFVTRSRVTRRQEKERGTLHSSGPKQEWPSPCLCWCPQCESERGSGMLTDLGPWKTSQSGKGNRLGCVPQRPLILPLGKGFPFTAFSNLVANTLVSQSPGLCMRCHNSSQMHSDLGNVPATCPLEREGWAWRQGEELSADPDRNCSKRS